MQKISRKIIAATLSTALIIPVGTGVATAQSSFGSSSADSNGSSTGGSKSVKFERALEQHLISNGQLLSPTAKQHAKTLLDRALNNDLPFVDNRYQSYDYDTSSVAFVVRLTPDEFEEIVQQIENGLEPDLGTSPEFSLPFGVAVGKDSEFYYVSLVLIGS
ncbi:hypothetical protein [Corynebacterium glutamicum]|uniref:hypothetical protein n=1 Tax=Corynebacterium glutamicum TaxID=1718 RepID=UPI0014697771|nr:hypothetical protein [Corynebacterium glutamicum]GFK17708.1 hypothetical protein KbCgl_02800 [Corynebacterium glutamicum]